MLPTRTLLLALTALVVACQEQTDRAPELSGNESWSVASAPAVSIGEGLGSADQSFHVVQAVARLTDGRIVVADGLFNSRLSIFAADGSHAGSLGGLGDGPGEYRWITSLQAGPGDSITIFDAALRRVTVYPLDSGSPRTISVVAADNLGGHGLFTLHRLADGEAWVGRGQSTMGVGEPGHLMRDTIAVGLLGESLDSFAVLETLPDIVFTTVAIGGQRGFGQVAFSPEVLEAGWGRCVFLVAGDSPRIAAYDAEGALLAEFNGPGVLRSVTREHLSLRAQGIEDRVADPQDAALSLLQFERQAKTTSLPYYGGLIVDRNGLIWLQEYQPPWGKGAKWFVLSQSGRLLTEVMLPSGFSVHEISEEGVLGVRRGRLDQEIVQLIPFTQQPSHAPPPLDSCVS